MATSANVGKSVLKLETDKTPNQVTLRCSGRLVSDTCEQFQSTVRELMPTTKLLVIDMSEVNYLDSSALGAIMGLYLSSKRVGCEFKLVKLTPRVKELLSLTRLTDVLASHTQGEVFGL
ncbi:MAG: STAS domain-containing protein [Terriglobales bacterium]